MRDPMSVNWVLSPLLSLSVPENVTAYRQNTEDQSKRERERGNPCLRGRQKPFRFSKQTRLKVYKPPLHPANAVTLSL